MLYMVIERFKNRDVIARHVRVLPIPMFVLYACAGAEPPKSDAPVASSQPSVTPIASATPSVSATTSATPSATTSSSTTTTSADTIERGEGTCRVDADCVLSGTLDAAVVGDHACCSYVCPPGRVVSQDIARGLDARHAAACAKPKLCPPPAPCHKPTTRLTPKCSAGRCVGVVHTIAVLNDELR